MIIKEKMSNYAISQIFPTNHHISLEGLSLLNINKILLSLVRKSWQSYCLRKLSDNSRSPSIKNGIFLYPFGLNYYDCGKPTLEDSEEHDSLSFISKFKY